MNLDIDKIKWYPLPETEYHKQEYQKNQITLHHMASGGTSKGDIDYWNSKDSPGKVAVAFAIDRDGTIWQAFSSKYYAAHLGTPTSTFTKFKINNSVDNLHKGSIAIELDSWGYLTKKDNKLYSYTGEEVKSMNVVTYEEGFRGQRYYEKYYYSQLLSLKDLIVYLCDMYKISKEYQCDMWDVSANALSGKNGIYTHVSYRESGKWDCHPQKELINMLQNLK